MKPMNYIKKNIKGILSGLSIMAIAILTSAFPIVKINSEAYVQSSAGTYSLVDYNEGVCTAVTTLPCAIGITEAGHCAKIQNLAPFTIHEINIYLNLRTPYISIINPELKIFTPN